MEDLPEPERPIKSSFFLDDADVDMIRRMCVYKFYI